MHKIVGVLAAYLSINCVYAEDYSHVLEAERQAIARDFFVSFEHTHKGNEAAFLGDIYGQTKVEYVLQELQEIDDLTRIHLRDDVTLMTVNLEQRDDGSFVILKCPLNEATKVYPQTGGVTPEEILAVVLSYASINTEELIAAIIEGHIAAAELSKAPNAAPDATPQESEEAKAKRNLLVKKIAVGAEAEIIYLTQKPATPSIIRAKEKLIANLVPSY